MKHRMRTRKLGRTSAHRDALFRNLVTSLLEHERIETTDVKAKELRRVAERMITLGKRGTLHARRQAVRVIRSREVASKVFGELATRYAKRAGGYTRVTKTRLRVGDAAPMSVIELVDRGAGSGAGTGAPKAPEKSGAKRKAKAAAASAA
jgi:large subunit ribosomal protein L17